MFDSKSFTTAALAEENCALLSATLVWYTNRLGIWGQWDPTAPGYTPPHNCYHCRFGRSRSRLARIDDPLERFDPRLALQIHWSHGHIEGSIIP